MFSCLQVLLLQLADDYAENINMLDVDLQPDVAPEYLSTPTIHVSRSWKLLPFVWQMRMMCTYASIATQFRQQLEVSPACVDLPMLLERAKTSCTIIGDKKTSNTSYRVQLLNLLAGRLLQFASGMTQRARHGNRDVLHSQCIYTFRNTHVWAT